jgi:hypothetical protein
MTSLSWVIT